MNKLKDLFRALPKIHPYRAPPQKHLKDLGTSKHSKQNLGHGWSPLVKWVLRMSRS